MSLTDRELSRVEEQRKENDVVVIVFLKASRQGSTSAMKLEDD